MSQLKEYVTAHPSAFLSPIRETSESLALAEEALGLPLPAEMKWLLLHWGYSGSCGVSNLQEAVARTIEWRQLVRLPADLLALEDWGDGGILLLEMASPTGAVHWIGSEDVEDLAKCRVFREEDQHFESFGQWVIHWHLHLAYR